ncbi:MAG: ABC transporter ATP-binding protein [Promethearchaeota archaeon]|jgi:ATP-binding cassette subfamily B protein
MSDYWFEEEEILPTKLSRQVIFRVMKTALHHKILLILFISSLILMGINIGVEIFLLKQLIDLGIIPRNMEMVKLYLILFGTNWGGWEILTFCMIYSGVKLENYILFDLRRQMFEHIQDLSFSYFDKTPVGWMMARVISDAISVSSSMIWGFHWILREGCVIIASIFFILIIDWRLALIVIGILFLLFYIGLKFQRRILKENRKLRSINANLIGNLNENITGVRIVKSFLREEESLADYQDITEEMYNVSNKAVYYSALLIPIVRILYAVMFGLILWFGTFQITFGLFTLGSLQAFITVIIYTGGSMDRLTMQYVEMQQSIASAEKIFSLLDTQPDITDQLGSIEKETINGEIIFERVSFYYKKKNPVLKDFSLSINPGETIALVGPTGGGKTTIVNLVCRFYEPNEGRILIDGRDYKEYTLNFIQSRLGVVLQTPHLFSGTIMENIRYGRLDATDEEVYEAAQLTYADEFIMKLDKNYKEPVGEGGVLLSQGQKQLISLARALVVKPDIVIMDEATSSVDSITEKLIQKGTQSLLKESTSFVIAHRLSTIQNADRILFIKEGVIKEAGTHKELLTAKGLYYNLFTRQFREEREKEMHILD